MLLMANHALSKEWKRGILDRWYRKSIENIDIMVVL
mgnify:FL=1